MSKMCIHPFGDRAFLIKGESRIDRDINARIFAIQKQLHLKKIVGVIETVPSYADLLVLFNPVEITPENLYKTLVALIDSTQGEQKQANRMIRIPVCYGGENGPDLEALALYADLPPEEVIQIHAATSYHVYMLGFTPGFPYLGGLDTRISCPRKQNPGLQIPAGSVGIAGDQTGIYPIDSPGGWQIIGQTPLRLFRPEKKDAFYIHPGDSLEFYPIGTEEFKRMTSGGY